MSTLLSKLCRGGMKSEGTAIEVVGLGKQFGKSWALNQIDLSIPSKQLVAVVGPSGCGKSTLLKLVAGLLRSSQGEVLLNGKPVTETPSVQLDIGMVLQDSPLYPHFKVRKNLQFSIRSQKLSKVEADHRVNEVAERLGISDILNRYPSDLSGGQRQRVAIGRAIIRRPKVLLLDEPMSQLDAHLRIQLRALLVDLHQQFSATTLYVTHDANEALEVADRILVMKEGRLVQDGAAEEIYQNPADQWVAEFVGDPPINFVPGCLRGNMLEVAASKLLLRSLADRRSESRGGSQLRDNVVIGFRPAKTLLEDNQIVDALCVQAIVKRVYRRQDRLVYLVSSELGEHRSVTAENRAISVGSKVWLAVSGTQMMLFDSVTGARIPCKIG